MDRFDTIELQQGPDHYIHNYNHECLRGKLKSLSPGQYRTQALSAG
ncbi:IS3 family transposase [Halomonas sp. WWR20]